MKKENKKPVVLTFGFIHIWDVKGKGQKGIGEESVGPENEDSQLAVLVLLVDHRYTGALQVDHLP